MGKLILVRHGHTSLNIPGRDERLRGWLDIPLDEQGLKEAAETADRLADHRVEAIFSSDLRRARQTAEVLRRRTSASRVTTSKELRPWNLGVFCGQRVFDILPFLNLLNQHPELAAPSGESFYQFYGRYSRRLTEMMNLADESSGCIVAVTHVRNVLATQTIIEHGDRDRVPVRGGPPTGTLMIVEKLNGIWRISTNDAHQPLVPAQTTPTQPSVMEARV
ncbi:MAG: histidine phosphatase family protein [Candidatus Sulfotelmatobacter sp.]